MRTSFASALLATAATAYQLSVVNVNTSQNLLDNKIAIAADVSTEWYWGLRSPVRWALFEDWHEAWSWTEEVYTKWNVTSYASVAFNRNGATYLGLKIAPWLRIFDIAFFENLFVVWPHEFGSAEAWDHCNYMGWWYKMGQLFVDIEVTLRECAVGVHNYIDSSTGWGCSSATYGVKKVINKKLKPFYKKEEGMYGKGYNTCDEAAEFDRHANEERSFWDSLKGSMEEVQESAGDVADGEEIDLEDGDYDDYY